MQRNNDRNPCTCPPIFCTRHQFMSECVSCTGSGHALRCPERGARCKRCNGWAIAAQLEIAVTIAAEPSPRERRSNRRFS